MAALGLAIVLAIDPDPFAPGAALLIAVGVWVYTLVSIAGMLLVRSPWARWLGLGVAVLIALVLAVTGLDSPGTILALVVSLGAVAGLAGPWLTVWLRQRPGTGPEPKAVALPLVAIGAPLVAGIAGWDGPTIAALIAALVGVVGGASYARSDRWGLWLLRLAYPVVAIAAGWQLGVPWGLLLIGHAGAVFGLAWTREASSAQRSIGSTLPAPRYRKRPS